MQPDNEDHLINETQDKLNEASCSGPFDRGEVTGHFHITWIPGPGRGCSLEEVPESLRRKTHSVVLILNDNNECGQLALAASTFGEADFHGHGWWYILNHKHFRDQWYQRARDITELLYPGRKNLPMELEDFQRYTEATGTKVFVHAWNESRERTPDNDNGQCSQCVFSTEVDSDNDDEHNNANAIHLLMQQVERVDPISKEKTKFPLPFC